MPILALILSLMIISLSGSAQVNNKYGDTRTPEGWAWAQILKGQSVDFSQHCGEPLNPYSQDGWNDPCRQVSPQFLVDILTQLKWRNLIPDHGVRLKGARTPLKTGCF